MTTEIVSTTTSTVLPSRFSLTPEQRDLLKRTLMPPNTTDDELALFAGVCEQVELNPFLKQIYAVRYGPNGKIVFQTGIDGFRLIAERSGKYEGQLGPFWCGPDGKWVDVWLKDEPPAAAKIGILKRGFREPLWAVGRYCAYNANTPIWKKMGAEQLAKCVESLAIRKAARPAWTGSVSGDV